jgi:hypothetical protein
VSQVSGVQMVDVSPLRGKMKFKFKRRRLVPPELMAVCGVILWVITLGVLNIELAYADDKGDLRCCIKLNSWLKRS